MQNSPVKNYLGAALIAMAAILFWLFVMPSYDGYQDLKAAVTERQTLIEKRQAILDKIARLQKDAQDKAASLDRVANIVPTAKNTADLVSTLEAISSQNGLQLVGASVTEQKAENINSSFGLLAVDTTLIGNYPAFLGFLDAIERNNRLINIQNVDVNEISGTSNLNIKIKANAYYLK